MALAAVVNKSTTEVARPLKVLVPLIKSELEAGDNAGIEHYRRAGEMLLEAKEQVVHGEWKGWVARNFPHRDMRTVQRYMKLAEVATKNDERVVFKSVRQAVDPGSGRGTRWYEPVKQMASRVNVESLAKEQQNREREQQMLHKLGHQLIDIGYKVLSAKLHPDKGGSSEAMARLNKVRSILKEAI